MFFYQANIDHSQRNRLLKNFHSAESTISLTDCELFLTKWKPSISVLLIDLDILKELHNGNCNLKETKPIKIGVDVKHMSENPLQDESRFEVVYFANNSNKDFLEFRMDTLRIIPKKFQTRWIGNFEIPKDIQQFNEFWKRSKFLNCMNITMNREETDKVVMPAQQSSDILARLRDELIENEIIPILTGGTLLGWYRECSVIPHTADMDFAVFSEDFKIEYLKKLENNGSTEFKIYRSLGRLTDSLEITVDPKKEHRPRIDIFIMYKGMENGTVPQYYTTGLSSDGTKYKFLYKSYNPWCAADLHGHIFWVTCTPKSHMEFEYGPEWYLDHPTSRFSWYSSGKNARENGKFTEEEMKEVYKVY